MLRKLIYASFAKEGLQSSDVRAIVDTSRAWNADHDITGMLCYGNGRFLQYLEGTGPEIESLYAHIVEDGRHRNVKLVEYKDTDTRSFSDWSMGFISVLDGDAMEIVRQATQWPLFEPERLNAEHANRLIRNLKTNLYPQIFATPGSASKDNPH